MAQHGISTGTIVSDDGRWLRIAALVTAILVGLPLTWSALQTFRASRQDSAVDSSSLERAIRLEPDNADHYRAMGRFLFFGQQDAKAAAPFFVRAANLEPTDSNIRLEQALVYEALGDDGRQHEALEQAIRLSPTTPSVAWEVANFQLAHGEVENALPNLKTVLASGVIDAGPVLEVVWRAVHDPSRIMGRVVPPDQKYRLRFLDTLVYHKEAAAAASVWSKVVEAKAAFDPKLAFGYLDFLLEQRQVPSAQQIWSDMATLNPPFRAYLPSENLIVNPSFAEEFLNGGFDWRYSKAAGISMSLDTTQVRTENPALVMQFNESTAQDLGLMQWVPVQPNTEYDFTAYIKSDDLAVRSGPRISLADAYGSTQYFLSQDFVGTQPWSEQRGHFRSGATSLLALRFLRTGNDPISGKLWLTDLTLRKTN
jgi:tetratricopeptide (TPR) repeat protein